METYRLFSLVAYDDSDTLDFSTIFSKLNELSCSYFYIKHDHDSSKTHYHIAIYFPHPSTIKSVASRLCVMPNYIKVKDEFGKRYTLKNTVGYFLHYNNKEKHQYNRNDLFSNDIDLINKYYDLLTGGNNEKNNLREIIQFIDYNNIRTISTVLKYCVENDLLTTFKKYSYILNQIVKENY